MPVIPRLYRESLALLTDLYELTMAQGYWKAGVHGRRAVFELFTRSLPFGGGFAVACGLAAACETLERFRLDEGDIAYLRGLQGTDGRPLFEPAFLEELAGTRFTADVDAVPEGTVIFANEPLVRVEGPVLECQVLETALLNRINFETLIATKAARVKLAADGDPVLEFGLRRAHGIDGGISASRAAYVGGCDATSNVLAGKMFGIPVRGTHAHSWIMFFDSEPEAFEAFARSQPGNCIFLVDTYNTIQGVRNAIEAGRRLRQRGFEMTGIRLDSGDLGALARQARRLLDESGFPEAAVVASGDLDEHAIARLKEERVPIGMWGVGSKLATAYGDPALGGVYKLVGVRRDDGSLDPRLKISDDPEKASFPGAHQVRRYVERGRFVADAMYDTDRGLRAGCTMVDLASSKRRKLGDELAFEDLLVPILRDGKRVADLPPAGQARSRAADQIARLGAGVKRLREPESYPVGLELGLHETRERLAREVALRTSSGGS
jgi:nicotinate phosphoribosyltransferase